MKYYIATFGCAANEADSERIAAYYEARGYQKAKSIKETDDVVINTCMVRQSAENRVYGLVNNIANIKYQRSNIKNTDQISKIKKLKIIVTGCMVGMAVREKTGRMLALLRKKMPSVDEFLPIEEVGFDNTPIRTEARHALVPISNGCNNFCTFCVVPFTRGREISRPLEDILVECYGLAQQGYTHITLVGQNVNSYGADIIRSKIKNPWPGRQGRQKSKVQIKNQKGETLKLTYVKHLGRLRIPTLFPQLLEDICKNDGIELIDFISSNPWDFSGELIETIAKNKKISRHIHLPVQSGDNNILKKMNRWYTAEQYLALISKIKNQISNITFSTDIIVGFPGETEKQFQNTVSLVKAVGFTKAYVAMYSDRPMTAAHNVYRDNISYKEKKRRWEILEEVINKTNLRAGTYR